MSDAKTMRLSKVAKEFNLSLGKITEFLATKGRSVENNPNAKIGDEEYSLLSKEFSGDKSAKEEAQHVGLSLNKLKRESIVVEDLKSIKAKELEELREKEKLEAEAAKIAQEKRKLEEQNKQREKIYKEVIVSDMISVGELANKMSERVADVIKELMKLLQEILMHKDM